MTLRDKKELVAMQQLIEDIRRNGFPAPVVVEELKMGIGKRQRRQYHKPNRKYR